MSEPQQQYYSGHRKHHVVHTQVVVDSYETICYLECGFLGQQNDAQQYNSMREIGTDLPFPHQCILFGDKIYPNNNTTMIPYTSMQLRRKEGCEKRKCLKLNRLIAKYRVCVQHAIAELKSYKSIGSVWWYKRSALPRVVHICGALVCRRKKIGLLV